MDPTDHDHNYIIVYPKDPNDSKTVKETLATLGKVCGSEHKETLRSAAGEVSWKVTLSDRETFRLLGEHPGLRYDLSVRRRIIEFSRRHEKRSDLAPRDDPTYKIVAKDPYNDEETKATREFINTKVTDGAPKIYEFSLATKPHVIGWGNVQLSEAAKKEVEAHYGVKPPLSDNHLIEED